jgi:GNAT superfamily N-acetyltransferase
MDGAAKTPKYQVVRMTNEDEAFYPTVGPFLSRRSIVAELGAPVWDDDAKVWHVAVAETGETLGIVGRRGPEVCSLYVPPEKRGLLIGAALLHAAATEAGDQQLRATVTEAGKPRFEELGFRETGSRGRFATMTRT